MEFYHRSVNALCISKENLNVLSTCYQIYKNDSRTQEVAEARKQVLELIQLKAHQSFKDGKKFIQEIVNKPLNNGDGIALITHTEEINDFCSSIDIILPELAARLGVSQGLNMRDAHEQLITKALSGFNVHHPNSSSTSDATYIFLTGNPGIGKTTAIVKFLKDRLDDGFLFFYVSPRKQVNLDIINKFKENYNLLCSEERLQKEILIDINERISRLNGGQLIVYIQDKPRLQRLIEEIKNQRKKFEKNRDYLEIHADISPQEKEDIDKYKNSVNVVFMTSSASRGLSFPKTKHILVDIPRFEIEKNLLDGGDSGYLQRPWRI
ncbi:MAG: hypothetical protein NVS2B14_17870 [Chamaesiphon sp.]